MLGSSLYRNKSSHTLNGALGLGEPDINTRANVARGIWKPRFFRESPFKSKQNLRCSRTPIGHNISEDDMCIVSFDQEVANKPKKGKKKQRLKQPNKPTIEIKSRPESPVHSSHLHFLGWMGG